MACPCALVISVPAAMASGLSAGARRGLLVKGGEALEAGSSHPLARAILAEATRRGVVVPAASDADAVPGKEVHGAVEGRRITVGSPTWAAEAGVLPDSTADAGRMSGVAELVQFSRATLANVKQNLAVAVGLTLIVVVTTVPGTTGLWGAILADTSATVVVTLNALRLLAWKPRR